MAAPQLLPLPAHMALTGSNFGVERALPLVLVGPQQGAGGDDEARIALAHRRLRADIGQRLSQVAAGALHNTAGHIERVVVAWRTPGATPQAVGEDESYVLRIEAPAVRIEAETPLGVLRAFATLSQWLQVVDGQLVAPGGSVSDAPRFAWRGVLLDSARHFLPVALIEQQLEAMAAVKFNVLHWHLTDDQAVRLESRRYPRLHELGSGGEYYTHEQIGEVVAFARARGIRVVPEIDMPGHTESWLLGYPELGAGAAPERLRQQWGIFDAALDPSKEDTYAFIDGLLGEVAELFDDSYVHIGGDEVTGVAWEQSPAIQAFMQRHQLPDKLALQGYFVHRVADLARAHGKQVVGWDEILQPGLPAGTVVQSWRGPQALAETIEAGYEGILSSGYYLGGSAADHYQNDPLQAFFGQAPRGVLGGEVCQWTELVPPELLNASLWPRAAAVAERLWSPAEATDVADMYARLQGQAARLARLGIEPLAPQRRLFATLGRPAAVASLATLATWLEASRANWWPAFVDKRPLDHFADALLPESEPARQFNELVRALFDHPAELHGAGAKRRTLKRQLAAIVAVSRAVQAQVAGEPALADASSLGAQAEQTAELGLWALRAYERDARFEPARYEQAVALLAGQENRAVGARLAFAPGVARLVQAVRPL